MKKTKRRTEPQPNDATPEQEPERLTRAGEGDGESSPANGSAMDDMRREATRWVQENQTAALLGAFGVGVFIGVLLRK